MKLVNSYCDQSIDKKLTKKRLRQIKIIKLRYFLVCLFGLNKIKWLKKHKVFAELGENVIYQPNKLPNNPQLIKIHDNVKIASNVVFYEHDIINKVFQTMDKCNYITHQTAIEIFENTFIGGNSIIVGNVKIGPNAIIGAGSVVTKDVPSGSVVCGNPAKEITKFENIHEKRKKNETNLGNLKLLDRYSQIWQKFYDERSEKNE